MLSGDFWHALFACVSPQLQIPGGMWSNPGCTGQDKQLGVLCAPGAGSGGMQGSVEPWVRLALTFARAAGAAGAGVWCLGRLLPHACATHSGVPWAGWLHQSADTAVLGFH